MPRWRLSLRAPGSQGAGQQAVAIRIRLVQAANGQPVNGASFDAARFGMWPTPLHKTMRPWMAHATGTIVAEGNGVYRLPVEVPMSGSYELRLSAHVPGGAEPVRDTVRIRVAIEGGASGGRRPTLRKDIPNPP